MTGLVDTGVVSEPGKNCGADAMASFGAPRPASLSKAVPFAPPTGIQRRREPPAVATTVPTTASIRIRKAR